MTKLPTKRYHILYGLWAGRNAKGTATWAGVMLGEPAD